MNQTLFQSAADAAGMLRRREVSSRELTELLLARIDAVNPALNADGELRVRRRSRRPPRPTRRSPVASGDRCTASP